MRQTSIIFRREIAAYLRSPVGYIIAAATLLADGLLFQTWSLGGAPKLSADVLSQFFYIASGTTMISAVVLSIRLIAEERQLGTLVLLNTSPVRDVEIIAGKFLSAFAFLSAITLITIYMPMLIFVNGKVSYSQIAVGYLGLLLLGSATLAIGVFATSISRQQLVAGVIGAIITVFMLLAYQLAQKLDPPLGNVFQQLGLYQLHFRGFMTGVFNLKDVVYYLAVTYFFLLLATKTLEAKRWQ